MQLQLHQLSKKQRVIQKILEGHPIDRVRSHEDVSRRMIQRWVAEFHLSGQELQCMDGSRSMYRHQQLSVGQINWLHYVLLSKCPKDFGFQNRLWTRNIIQKLIRHWCLGDFHCGEVYTLMGEMGFSFINPLPTVHKSPSKRVQSWVAKDLAKIYDFAKLTGSRIHCIGELSLQSCFQVVASPANRTGATIIRQAGHDSGNNVVFAFDQHKKGVRFIVRRGSVDIEAALDFIDRFSEDFPRPSILLVPKPSSFSSEVYKLHIRKNFPLIKIFSMPAGAFQ